MTMPVYLAKPTWWCRKKKPTFITHHISSITRQGPVLYCRDVRAAPGGPLSSAQCATKGSENGAGNEEGRELKSEIAWTGTAALEMKGLPFPPHSLSINIESTTDATQIHGICVSHRYILSPDRHSKHMQSDGRILRSCDCSSYVSLSIIVAYITGCTMMCSYVVSHVHV